MTVRRPLPGIRFEAEVPPLRDALPRMDIPLFAGFAAAGPLHRPVAVEDYAQFDMIFGGDVELPRPAGERLPPTAHLASAVRSFFRNGGDRCWIVRVAGDEAELNVFPIPGLAAVVPHGTTEAVAVARSKGSWSDGLGVQTNLLSEALKIVAFSQGAPIAMTVTSPRDIVTGDLLRFASGDPLFAVVASVEKVAEGLRITALPLPIVVEGEDTPSAMPRVERLTFDLTVRGDAEAPLQLSRLGFHPDHPRYFGALPSDENLFDVAPARWAELRREAANPRFALAAPAGEEIYLPLGMTSALSAEAHARHSSKTPLERNGLAELNAALFLDPALAQSNVRDLIDDADAVRYRSAPGRELRGIHAVLGIEEVSIIAAPDAVHHGWSRDLIALMHVAPPTPSHMAVDEPAPHGFVDCFEPLEVPSLVVTLRQGNWIELTWAPDPDAVDEIVEAESGDFAGAVLVAQGATGLVALHGRPPGDYSYRIRRTRNGRTSAWSAPPSVHIGGVDGFNADDADAPAMLDVHQAMLRLCAARGDMVAVLSLPRDYDAERAMAYAAALASRFPNDDVALSYGSLWHPWLIGRDDEAGPLRATPPDGAVAGVMAARAVTSGAWVAAANTPLRGVVALTPPLPREQLQALQDAAINVIRHEPHGFVALDSDTLTTDADIRPLNVRRLLILVRRAAQRTGNVHLFEPNGPALRGAVKRGFESMLESMFARGAFAGRTTSSAFQVVVGEGLNTPAGVDAGRLIAELKIAPSRPLSFLTIRLLQRGETAVAQEVR